MEIDVNKIDYERLIRKIKECEFDDRIRKEYKILSVVNYQLAYDHFKKLIAKILFRSTKMTKKRDEVITKILVIVLSIDKLIFSEYCKKLGV